MNGQSRGSIDTSNLMRQNRRMINKSTSRDRDISKAIYRRVGWFRNSFNARLQPNRQQQTDTADGVRYRSDRDYGLDVLYLPADGSSTGLAGRIDRGTTTGANGRRLDQGWADRTVERTADKRVENVRGLNNEIPEANERINERRK